MKLLIASSVFLIIFSSSNYSREVPVMMKSGPLLGYDMKSMQARVMSIDSLSVLMEEEKANNGDSSFGFSSKSIESSYFMIGVHYTSAIWYVGKGKVDFAVSRLTNIAKQFQLLEAPSLIHTQLEKIVESMDEGKYKDEAYLDFLLLLKPFIENHVQNKSDDYFKLLQAGEWLINMKIAASAGNLLVLRENLQLTQFEKMMKEMDAPAGVQNALAEINTLVGQKDIKKNQFRQAISLIRKIERILG